MNELIKQIADRGLPASVQQWMEKRFTTECKLTDGEHILDWIEAKNPKKLYKMRWDEALGAADKWTKAQSAKGENIKEDKDDVKVALDFKDGFKFVQLVGKRAYEREGYLMSHCVASYYGKDDEIYSLRDSKNMPHATISRSSQQIKGKGNGSIHPEYIRYVVEFLDFIKVDVRDSEMMNLGYLNVEKYLKYLDKESQKSLFKKKYWYRFGDKLKTKDGNEFATLDWLDQISLIEKTRTGLRINFELKSFIKASVDFIFSAIKKVGTKDYSQNASSGNSSKNASSGYYSKNASSGNSSKNASSGYYSQNASSGDSSRNASSGYYSQNASSGYYSQNASSGNSSKNASSGYYSQNASSGYYSKNASSGDSSRNASSGNSSKNASSGDSSRNASSGNSSKNASSGYYSQNASSGYYGQNASSGDYSQNASSGDYSQNASSGDSSRNEMTGLHSVSVDAGHGGQAKGKKDCWFCLSEWVEIGDHREPKCVKAVKIDGVKIKEDTWYTLKNGKFVEVKS